MIGDKGEGGSASIALPPVAQPEPLEPSLRQRIDILRAAAERTLAHGGSSVAVNAEWLLSALNPLGEE